MPAAPDCGDPASDSRADFFRQDRFASFEELPAGSDVNQGAFPMTFVGPLLSRLSVVTAYLAFAFVGAIVLGVF